MGRFVLILVRRSIKALYWIGCVLCDPVFDDVSGVIWVDVYRLDNFDTGV